MSTRCADRRVPARAGSATPRRSSARASWRADLEVVEVHRHLAPAAPRSRPRCPFVVSAMSASMGVRAVVPGRHRHQGRRLLERRHRAVEVAVASAAARRAPSARCNCPRPSRRTPSARRAASSGSRRPRRFLAAPTRSLPNILSRVGRTPSACSVESTFSASFSASSVSSPFAYARSSLCSPSSPYFPTMCSTSSDAFEIGEAISCGRSVNAAFRSRSLSVSFRLSMPANSTCPCRAPTRPRNLLFVHRDAFSEPPRHPLVRHLERDHVRQLVPQRRFPLNSPGGRACGESIVTTRPKHAPSAPIIPGSADVANGEVVVLREDLDQDRTLRRELVPLDHRRPSPRARARAPESWITGASSLSMRMNEVAVADGDELVQRVHHLEQVVGHDVVADVSLNDCSSTDRASLSSPVRRRCDAQVGENASVIRVERNGPFARASTASSSKR